MVERRQDQDPRRPFPTEQAPRRLDPVGARHADVHQDDVGREARGEPRRLLAVLGLADDLEVGLALEDDAEAAADERLVVREQDPDHAGAPWSGMRARISKPPVAPGPLVSVPP